MLDKRQITIESVIKTVDKILNYEMEVIEGAKKLFFDVIDDYDFHSESKHYCYDSIGLEKIYGLFDTYEERLNADRAWQTEKTNVQLMEEIKTELRLEPENWINKQKNDA